MARRVSRGARSESGGDEFAWAHDVFLSYARADNVESVDALESYLVSAGLSVWRDKAAMPSRGLSFLEEIRRLTVTREGWSWPSGLLP